MLFDHCAQCRMCCNVEPGYPPLEISLTKNEKQKWKSLCVETQCDYLGKEGCTLEDKKPFSCKMYPLAFDPKSRRFFFDSECPLMATYLEQLVDPNSDASIHLEAIQHETRALLVRDASFLKRNFSIDSDYFALQQLPVPPLSATENE